MELSSKAFLLNNNNMISYIPVLVMTPMGSLEIKEQKLSELMLDSFWEDIFLYDPQP